MQTKSTPVKYSSAQMKKGVSRSDVVANQSTNNKLWASDRLKLDGLQEYIRTLQEKGIVSK